MRKLAVLVFGLFLPASLPLAAAADWADDLSASPPTWNVAGWEARVSGFATGSAFTAREEGGPLRGSIDDSDVTGLAEVNLRLQHMFDDGLTMGIRSTIVAYHDTLSGDRYGSDTFEKLYLFATTAYGTIEIGQVDGAASRLAVTGPKVDDHVTLDDPDTAFFVNPDTGRRFDDFFYPYTASWSSANDAKISFISTRLLGFQAGVSFTPQTVKSPFLFGGNPADGPHQANLWEAVVTYTGFLSNDFAVNGSVAYTHGDLENQIVGEHGADISDFAVGAQAQYTTSEIKFTLGAAYRISNAYAFNTSAALDGGDTHLVHTSALIEWGDWRAGAEYSHGDVDGAHGLAGFTLDAYQVAGGYRINDNMQLTAGWQWFNYDRDFGVFFNGRSNADMNAGFLTLGYTL